MKNLNCKNINALEPLEQKTNPDLRKYGLGVRWLA
jgi:hypothetical protein